MRPLGVFKPELALDLIEANEHGYLTKIVDLLETDYYSDENPLIKTSPKEEILRHIKPFSLVQIESAIMNGSYDVNYKIKRRAEESQISLKQ